jgi:hypothetical protein
MFSMEDSAYSAANIDRIFDLDDATKVLRQGKESRALVGVEVVENTTHVKDLSTWTETLCFSRLADHGHRGGTKSDIMSNRQYVNVGNIRETMPCAPQKFQPKRLPST